MKRTIDAGAECIPLALAFTAAAGGLASLKPLVGR